MPTHNSTTITKISSAQHYVDAEVPVLRRMFAKRLRAYRALGYELAEA
ncbi:MAG TPA: hypothetical protein VED41_05720 [Solirubrobacteraceae bacterium]|nr:hypothetical protein [Solirubrobacteraceae bacterium]